MGQISSRESVDASGTFAQGVGGAPSVEVFKERGDVALRSYGQWAW